jgi:phosphoribosylformylglycinamidine synthase
MSARFGVVVFPGSNCDHDAYHATGHVLGQEARFIWHKEQSVGDVDVVIVPGGFSYGDYLRAGAIARFSPVMKDVVRFAREGGIVLGICNGFQILCEAGLLPGALTRNASLRFRCQPVHLRVETTDSPFTNTFSPRQVLQIPIAHGEGNYTAPRAVLDDLESSGRIAFRYCDESGNRSPGSNPNGSAADIAGVLNEGRNVLGMMPHPERHVEALVGSRDGMGVFESIIRAVKPVHV